MEVPTAGHRFDDDGSRGGANGCNMPTTSLGWATTGLKQASTGCRLGDDKPEDGHTQVSSKVYKDKLDDN